MKRIYAGPFFCAPENTPNRDLRTYLITDKPITVGISASDFTEIHGRSMGEAAAYWATEKHSRSVGAAGLTVRVHVAVLGPDNLHDTGVPIEIHTIRLDLSPEQAQP